MLPDDLFIQPIDIELQEWITNSEKYDTLSTTMLKALLDKKPELVDKKYTLYETEYGPLLLFKNRVVIPEDVPFQYKIIERYHDNPTTGHPGEQETYR